MGQFFIKRGDKIQGPATLQQIENLRAKLKATDLIGEAPNGPWTTWEQAESKLFPALESLPFADLDIPVATPPTTWQQPTQPQAPQATASEPAKNNKALILGMGIGGAVFGLLFVVLLGSWLFGGSSMNKSFQAKVKGVQEKVTKKYDKFLSIKYDIEKTDSVVAPYKGTIVVTGSDSTEIGVIFHRYQLLYSYQNGEWTLQTVNAANGFGDIETKPYKMNVGGHGFE